MEMIKYVNYLIAMVFICCYSYQLFYVAAALLKKPRTSGRVNYHRYAVLISARNEEAVIAQLIKSIRNQSYPSKYVDIYVVADNCTDRTAEIARANHACVWERFNTSQVGKGYALRFLFQNIKTAGLDQNYDGYFIFDADNLLDEYYIENMNRTFSDGHRIITSYRNSKNFGDNWISAGYSLWFLRESRYLNQARMSLGSSCAVSGTGFLVHSDIVKKNQGWNHFLLTEDIEFTVDSILQGERIAYCPEAVLYDEQPVSFRQSWNQRLRWAKGNMQVFANYGGKLIRNIFEKGSFACYDMVMSIMPAIILTVLSCILNTAGFIVSLVYKDADILVLLQSIGEFLVNGYLMMLAMGALTAVTEWKRIHAPAYKKIAYVFTFPLFMITYIPISIAALFKKVEWKPIHHGVSKTLDEVRAKV